MTAMKICLLVPTYKRNIPLVRLLTQMHQRRSQYTGPCEFHVAVTDSDRNNEARHIIEPLCDKYITNEGVGFDDNMYFFYSKYLDGYDYVLSISDDDLLSVGSLNPLDLIELATKGKADAVLFGHRSYTTPDINAMDFQLTLQSHFYDRELFHESSETFRLFMLGYIPRHIGIMYRCSLIQNYLPQVELFRDTLHLFAAPFMLAARDNKIEFADVSLAYFNDDQKGDGAWQNETSVISGLIKFQKVCKTLMSPADYEILERGFWAHYFGNGAMLRSLIRKNFPSEGSIRAALAA
ncbi:hypothetical protein GFB49_08265 [Epibacterium sp. SM1979]|uniref:Glycosyl transferase family 2 n=1 Tax=Tritonibacter litoralis TaxID=2662264 RepID=A0A843YGQ7_9RHOB|nr:hypothetical protein [Tritonibacter litoralis]MQQ08443.1 hypothetical protein [Tritonibacter litoralis]